MVAGAGAGLDLARKGTSMVEWIGEYFQRDQRCGGERGQQAFCSGDRGGQSVV